MLKAAVGLLGDLGMTFGSRMAPIYHMPFVKTVSLTLTLSLTQRAHATPLLRLVNPACCNRTIISHPSSLHLIVLLLLPCPLYITHSSLLSCLLRCQVFEEGVEAEDSNVKWAQGIAHNIITGKTV